MPRSKRKAAPGSADSRPQARTPAKKAPRRDTYHHGDLANALVAAALESIAAHGLEGFTLRDTARRAGVSPAAPYRHFADRDDVLAAVASDCATRLGDALERAAVAAVADGALAVFRATGVAYVRFAVEHPAHFRVMNMPAVAARLPPPARAEIGAWFETARAQLAAAQAAGEVADLPLDQIMLAAHCLVHGLAHLIVDGQEGFADATPDAAAAFADAVTAILGHGLLPRAHPMGPRRRR